MVLSEVGYVRVGYSDSFLFTGSVLSPNNPISTLRPLRFL